MHRHNGTVYYKWLKRFKCDRNVDNVEYCEILVFGFKHMKRAHVTDLKWKAIIVIIHQFRILKIKIKCAFPASNSVGT